MSADDKTVNFPVFVQCNSKHPYLLGTYVLSHLGFSTSRANGQPLTLKHSLQQELTLQVRLVEASVIPGE